MKIEIKKTDGKWLINAKQYTDLSDDEKQFFNEFIIAMKWQFDDNLIKKQS